MKMHDQEHYHSLAEGTYGDCMRAALRTLLQDDLKDCPHPVCDDGWSEEWEDYLEEKGIVIRHTYLRDGRSYDHIPEICIAVGPAARGVSHAVVYNRITGTMIHDPHPSRSGLLKINWYYHVLDHVT